MTAHARKVVLLGLLVTLLVVLVDLAGLLDRVERESIDERFALARWSPAPMSESIHHVDIDDGAIDSVGRWPWHRSRLADAIDEMQRAGAGTIAIDLLLTEPDEAVTDAAGREVDHDAVLAKALGATSCVLPVVVSADASLFGARWASERGMAELEALLGQLRRDVRLEPADAADRASLTGLRRSSALARPMQFKRVAAWQALQGLIASEPEPPDWDSFLAAVAPGVDAHTGEFPERRLLEQVWSQHLAWGQVQGCLQSGRGSGSADDSVPLPVFAAQADMVGFVNRETDDDGEIRQVSVLRRATGGTAVHFGLAAAARFRGLGADDVEVDEEAERVTIGDVSLPMHRGKLPLYWPTAREGWLDVHRTTDDDLAGKGHTSIGALVSMAEQRRKLSAKEAERERVAMAILELDDPAAGGLTEAMVATIDEQAAFLIDQAVELSAQGGTLTAEEEAELAPYRHWRLLNATLPREREALGAAEGALRQRLGGKLVFIGWTATAAAADFVHTPLDAATPGVVVHAVVADMALTGRAPRFLPGWLSPALAGAMGLLCTVIAARLTPAAATLVVLAALAAYVGAAGWWLFGAGDVVVPLAAPTVAGAGAWVACTVLAAVLFQADRSRITRQFRARVAPQLVDYLVEKPDALSVRGEQREITVMFIDIAGFTSMAEMLGGPTTVATLNVLMGELTARITAEHGYVNKFLGDGLMAFWSAFHDDPNQARRACAAAMACQEALERLGHDTRFAGLPRLYARIGIATDLVIVGDCGAPPQLNDYTVIGNGVNLASRLESANKQFGSRILIDGRTHALLAIGAGGAAGAPGEAPGGSGPAGDGDRAGGGGGPLRRFLGRVVVVGQSIPVDVYELTRPDTDKRLIDLTNDAVQAFIAGDRERSVAKWREVVSIAGPNKLASLYLDALAAPGGESDGVLRLREK